MASELGDVFGVRIDTAATAKALKQLERDLDRASMQALRAAGRVVKQEGRKRAPVYSGDDPRVPPGRLKASVHSGRRLKRLGPGSYAVNVGPWGPVVNFYRSRVGGRYMENAHAAGASRMGEKFDAAYRRVLERAGR